MATETRTPRAGEALDEAALGAWLREALPDAAADPVIRQFPGGASNLTYLITVGERDYVLRRPPFGTKAASAHDMEREYRILSALRPVYPYCPRPVAWCGDKGVLGEAFYLMERLSGTILRRELPPGLSLTPAAATDLCRNLVDVHVELHRVDYEAAGLASFGKPAGYVGRQVHGWSKRYRAARTDDVPDNEALMEWLAAQLAMSTAWTVRPAPPLGTLRVSWASPLASAVRMISEDSGGKFAGSRSTTRPAQGPPGTV